jgi:hypothetical protein
MVTFNSHDGGELLIEKPVKRRSSSHASGMALPMETSEVHVHVNINHANYLQHSCVGLGYFLDFETFMSDVVLTRCT